MAGAFPAREIVLHVSCCSREGGHLHSVDGQSLTQTEQADDFGLGGNPHLCPLEGALGLRVKEDSSDAD